MAAHVFLRTTAPSAAPTEIGNHWIDTVSKIEYFSVGTSSTADWVAAAGSNVVTSVFGRTGVVTAQSGDYDTTEITEAGDRFFISAADLALIGSSAQPGDNISIFVNDSGFITAAGAPVQSVNSQTGTVVLDADDIDDTSTTNKFATQAELDQITTNQTDIANLEGQIILSVQVFT